LTLCGGLVGAALGSFMTNEIAVIICYVLGLIVVPYGALMLFRF
jgi:hypothetical protein